MSAEEWRPVPGFPKYEVSDRGRIRSYRFGVQPRLLRPRISAGYPRIPLYNGGQKRDAFIHHLVLETFVGPCPEGLEGCHRDDDPANNRLTNLRWDTRSANIKDSVRNGTHHMARRTHCPQGHPYTPENTYHPPRGGRQCRACNRAAVARLKARRAAVRRAA